MGSMLKKHCILKKFWHGVFLLLNIVPMQKQSGIMVHGDIRSSTEGVQDVAMTEHEDTKQRGNLRSFKGSGKHKM